MSVSIDAKQALDQLRKRVIISDNQLDELKEEILKALATRLRDLIEEKAPKDTGKYAKEWKVGEPTATSINITNPDGLKYTILEFTGRSPGKIKGNPLLHFVIGGKDIFVTFVNHPGTQPEPHVRPALEQLGREAKKIILDMIKEKFPMFQ